MRRVNCLHRRVARLVNQIVIIDEKNDKRCRKECRNQCAAFLHKAAECVKVNGEITAEHEDEDVMENPVIETIHEERFPKRTVGQTVRIKIERDAET